MADAAERGWPHLLTALIRGEDLSAQDTAWAMGQVMAGEATAVQTSGFLVALRAKGETVDEVTGCAQAILDVAAPLHVDGPIVDVVGTGGDRAHTVNISTMAAMAVAAAGARVVKHGNRAASSACGAADLLEELGVPLDLAPQAVGHVAEQVGITFCFAPTFHPSFRHAAVPRRELGVATVFNFLGPLSNPAQPSAQAVGCADPRMAGVMAGVFAGRGVSALVFRGDDGLDELTTTTTSRVWVVGDGQVTETSVDPAALGIAPVQPEALRGADAPYNAAVARRFLAGEPGPVREVVLLNAAATLAAYRGTTAERLLEDLAAAHADVAAAVDSGAAEALLERWVEVAGALR
jgi:anthranilate phosphoribosyltransferase